MGITGLIPFLEKASKSYHVNQIAGRTVCVDTYCWLHKSSYQCAEDLVKGEQPDAPIFYCLKYLDMLISFNIKPICVFDGQRLPAKKLTEEKRRERRQSARKEAFKLQDEGKFSEAKKMFQRCVDITHALALRLIKACRERNIDCIVAPYEADAQMAFLNRRGIADYVITEDSDLVLFGCQRILFKLSIDGSCRLFQAEQLNLTMGVSVEKFSFDKFRYMCILSGCDYLDSLPGIGLGKAKKFFLKTEDTDIRRNLSRVPSYLGMRTLVITEEYKTEFQKADATFQYMVVYDPIERKLCRLNELPEGFDETLISNAGEFYDGKFAFELAIGNIDPNNGETLDKWRPPIASPKGKNITKHPSIWRPSYFDRLKHKTAARVDEEVKPDPIRDAKRSFVRSLAAAEETTTAQDTNDDDILCSYLDDEPIPPPKKPRESTPSPERPSKYTKFIKTTTVVTDRIVISRFFAPPELLRTTSDTTNAKTDIKKSIDALNAAARRDPDEPWLSLDTVKTAPALDHPDPGPASPEVVELSESPEPLTPDLSLTPIKNVGQTTSEDLFNDEDDKESRSSEASDLLHKLSKSLQQTSQSSEKENIFEPHFSLREESKVIELSDTEQDNSLAAEAKKPQKSISLGGCRVSGLMRSKSTKKTKDLPASQPRLTSFGFLKK